MDFCIVVARYNECLEWTKQFPNVVIYNKGLPIPGFNQTFLNNVGREGHTYYQYICDNYDNLAEYTCFLQGNPFDHSPYHLIDNINKYINYKDKDLRRDFEFLSEAILHCNLEGCYHHPDLPLINVFEKLFDERKENMEFKFGAGAQFVVSKKLILKRPKEFYLKIVEMLSHSISPIEGYVIERFHKLIFN